MKKFTMISLLLFMLFFSMTPAFAESYVVQVPVSYTGTQGNARIIFTSQETKRQSVYTIDRQTKALTLSYTSLGTYHYSVTKEAGQDANILYDDRTYQVIITLTRTNNDVIRKSIIVYLASSLTKLSEITYADHRLAAADVDHKANQIATDNQAASAIDRASNQAKTQNQATAHDNTQKQAVNKDKKAKEKSQSSKAVGTKKKTKSQKSKVKNKSASSLAGKKKTSSQTGSKSSTSSSGNDGTNTSNAGENDDHSSTASTRDAGDGKNKQMNNSQDTTGTQNQSTQNTGVIHTGDTTTFVQWIVLMIASMIGMLTIKRRKG